ncbi:MAG: YhcH/YjgK/YiaL family protein [Lachnospiraceae bacterium]|nr:YhcH/YjgK/YiaL family protein [Lachnospiraceae bacterium]
MSTEDLKKRVSAAAEYLQTVDVKSIPAGEKQVVNDGFFFTLQTYETKEEKAAKFEAHKEYVDIQMMVSGKEFIDIASTKSLTVKEPYDENKDVAFYNPPKRFARMLLNAGSYVILYPEDAHRPTVQAPEAETVVKLIGKVRIYD